MLKVLSALVGIALALTACGESTENMSLKSPPPAPPGPTKEWMVFFDTNSTALSQQSQMTVQQAAQVAKSVANARVSVTGFTDTEGSPAYNMQLSQRRANAVRNALVQNGIPAQSVSITGDGETNLLVQTGDQVKNEKNRRVRIVVQ